MIAHINQRFQDVKFLEDCVENHQASLSGAFPEWDHPIFWGISRHYLNSGIERIDNVQTTHVSIAVVANLSPHFSCKFDPGILARAGKW